MNEVTLIVAPNYLAEITGITAIKISARKIYLCDALLNTRVSCFRKAEDDMSMDFIGLVKLVCNRVAQ